MPIYAATSSTDLELNPYFDIIIMANIITIIISSKNI